MLSFLRPGLLPLLALAALVAPGLRAQAVPVASDPREVHLSNLRQLTFGGENAEAYWTPDGKSMTLQARRDGAGCDRIYLMNVDGTGSRQISSGLGATTCSYFLPPERVLYASTLLGGHDCPPKPDFSMGYVWALYPSYDLFTRRLDGFGLTRLTRTPGYDAEATVSPDGKQIIFTSMRTGDPELFVMNADGSDLRQLTDDIGYDGGAFFTPDGKQIVWRRTSEMTPEQEADYKRLLGKNLVRPSSMDLWVMNADGSEKREVLANGAANFAPYGLPSGEGMLFASNMEDAKGRNFDIFKIRYDGTGLERITFYEGFDSFPMFSPDGKQVLFSSNRFGKVRGETNVFVADWIE